MSDPNGQINVQDRLPEVGVLEQARQMAHLLIERGYSALKAEIEEDHRDPKQMNQTPISQANEHDHRESLEESGNLRTAESSFLSNRSLSSLSLDEIMALIERNIQGEGDYYDLQKLLAVREFRLEKHPWNSDVSWVDKEERLPLEQVIS